jgi:AAA+ superfamily predicted ATPase
MRLVGHDQRSVRAPELDKTLLWPWYQIMAYHPPNRFILPTWTDSTSPLLAQPSAEHGQLLRVAQKSPERSSGRTKAKAGLTEQARAPGPVGPWSTRASAVNKLKVCSDRVLGPSGQTELCAADGNTLESQNFDVVKAFGCFDMGVERLRLEDDSIPSKKDSIYSKKKIHQDTLSARVLNVVKKSFYDYGLSIPGAAKPPILVASNRAELLLSEPRRRSAEHGRVAPRPQEDLDKLVDSKNENLSTFGKDSVNRKFLAPLGVELLPALRKRKAGKSCRNEARATVRNLNKSELLGKPTQSSCQEKPNLAGVLNVTNQPAALRETANLSETERGRGRVSGSLDFARSAKQSVVAPPKAEEHLGLLYNHKIDEVDLGLRSNRLPYVVGLENSTKPPVLSYTQSGAFAEIFQNITIPKKSFWEYAHSISGYNFPELQDYEVADLFADRRSVCPVGASRERSSDLGPTALADRRSVCPVGARKMAASDKSKVGVVTRPSKADRRHNKVDKASRLALISPANSWFCIDTNHVFLTPYLAKVPPKVLLTASTKTEGLSRHKTEPCSRSEHEAVSGFVLGLLAPQGGANRNVVPASVRGTRAIGRLNNPCSASLSKTYRRPTFCPPKGGKPERSSGQGPVAPGRSFALAPQTFASRKPDESRKPDLLREDELGLVRPAAGAASVEQAKVRLPETFVEVGSNVNGRNGAAPAARSVCPVGARVQSRKDSRQFGRPLAEDFTIRYTPLELDQIGSEAPIWGRRPFENKVKKAFKELGRDYSDYLKQPKDSLPALLLSPSLEEDKQIEEEEVQRLAQEKAAAKAAEKRTRSEEEYSISDSEAKQDEFTSIDLDPSVQSQTELRSAIEVALRADKNNANNIEEEPLNDEETEDSIFERLRFTRDIETKKEEEDCRGLALSFTCRDSNAAMSGLEGAGFAPQSLAASKLRQPFRAFNFVRARNNLIGNFAGTTFRQLLLCKSSPALSRSEIVGTKFRPGPVGPLEKGAKTLDFTSKAKSDEVALESLRDQTKRGALAPAAISVAPRHLAFVKGELQPYVVGQQSPKVLRCKTNLLCATRKVSEELRSANLVAPQPKVSDRKHSFFGQRSFWPTRLFSQEERLVSAHIVNPYIRYDQSNPWLLPEGGGLLPVTSQTERTGNCPASCLAPSGLSHGPSIRAEGEPCKTDDLQNLKNLQAQARLGLVRFVHLPVVEAASVTGQSSALLSGAKLRPGPFGPWSECNPQGRGNIVKRASAGGRLGLSEGPRTLLVDFASPDFASQSLAASQLRQSVTHKAGRNYVPVSRVATSTQNRIYKPDPRLRLTPLESSISADWRDDRKVEASPFRITSKAKERPHIVLPQLSENEWQKSLEWQLKRHFLDEDTRLEPLVATQPYKTFKVKRIERSLPWLTLEKPSFKLFQWPYKTVGQLLLRKSSLSALSLSGPGSASAVPLGRNYVPVSCFTTFNPSFAQAQSLTPTGVLATRARATTYGRPVLTRAKGLPVTFFEEGSTALSPSRLLNYSRIPMANSFTTYSTAGTTFRLPQKGAKRSALSVGSSSFFDVTKKLFNSQDDLNTELLFEPPSTSSWFLIYRLFLALILKEVLKYIYRISLKDFFLRIINSDFGRTITSPEFRQSVQFEPFPDFYKPKNRLKDLIGIKNSLLPLSEIIWFLRNNCRSRNGPHGVVLLGPEGVDTTSIAQAVAGEAKVPIIVQSLRALTLTHSHPQKRLEKVLLLARAQAPCVLFLDELDVIGQSRKGVIRKTSGDGNSLISLDSSQLAGGQPQLQSPDDQATSQGRRVDLMLRLLTVMDGLHHLNGVVIITTSKNTATLDPALLRPGRFDRLIHLTLPNHEHRMELFKVKTKGLGYTDQMPWEYLSLQTANMGGADIVSAINYSILRAIVNDTVHTVETLEYGLNCVKAVKALRSKA